MPLPSIPALPTPPQRGTDSNADFITKADTWVAALPTFSDEIEAFGQAVYDETIADAADANYAATSATSVAIGTGTKNFTTQANKRYIAGTFVLIASAAAPSTNYMFGQVASYNLSTGALVVDSQRTSGSGTYTDWQISLSGPQGEGGDVLPAFSGNAGKVLRVNSGETATQWDEDGWELIGTVSPSGAATSGFSSIGTTYEDLLCTFSFTQTSGGLGLNLSADGSSWATAALFGSSMTAPQGALFIPGFKKGYGGLMMNVGPAAASPSISTIATANALWAITGGIGALRFNAETGNLSGTASLFGRR